MLLYVIQFIPDVLATECLQCYQCSSNSNDPDPNCDTNYWYTLTVKKKKQLIVSCPDHRRDFCVKKTTLLAGGRRIIERGCSGRYDMRGIEFKEGCAFITHEENELTVCFCTQNLCNIGMNDIKTDRLLLIMMICYFILY